MLSEISQTEWQIPYDCTYMWNLKNSKWTNKQKQAHRYREQSDDVITRCVGVGGMGEIVEGIKKYKLAVTA